jgi:glycerophosphoryl diester phosphodiesterase
MSSQAVGLPKVFGHRGSSGYRPENTLEAIELAFQQGADAVEFDVVPTGDERPIVRHDSWLNDTTNVADHPEFASRFREVTLYERWKISDWFSTDFTVAEIKTLFARERLPEERPGSAKFDDQFLIPTLDDLLAADFINGKTLILEVKHGRLFANLGAKFDPVPMVKTALEASNWQSRGISLVFESFDFDVLLAMKAALGPIGKYVFLTERVRLPEGTKEVPAELLDRVAANFDGISVEWALLFSDLPEGSVAQFGQPNDLAARAHSKGLTVSGWTARAEEAKYSVDEYYQNLISTGVDGIFADQPDLLRRVVADLA